MPCAANGAENSSFCAISGEAVAAPTTLYPSRATTSTASGAAANSLR